MSGFARISDTKSVVQFVKDVESQPCLYDIKSQEYVNQALKRKSWMNIAKKWNCTVAECKDKWRKIRTAYMRSFKPKFRNNKWLPSRPYYLASYLKFIAPTNIRRYSLPPSNNKDIKIEIGSDNENELGDSDGEADDKLDSQDEEPVEMLEVKDCFDDGDEEYFDDNETLMDDEDNISHEINKEEKAKQHPSIKNSIETIKNEVKTKGTKEIESRNSQVTLKDSRDSVTNEVNKTIELEIKHHHSSESIEQRCSYCANIESKPRKMLLFSLLPDIEALSEQQMRIFRRELINLVDKCKYDVNDVQVEVNVSQ